VEFYVTYEIEFRNRTLDDVPGSVSSTMSGIEANITPGLVTYQNPFGISQVTTPFQVATSRITPNPNLFFDTNGAISYVFGDGTPPCISLCYHTVCSTFTASIICTQGNLTAVSYGPYFGLATATGYALTVEYTVTDRSLRTAYTTQSAACFSIASDGATNLLGAGKAMHYSWYISLNMGASIGTVTSASLRLLLSDLPSSQLARWAGPATIEHQLIAEHKATKSHEHPDIFIKRRLQDRVEEEIGNKFLRQKLGAMKEELREAKRASKITSQLLSLTTADSDEEMWETASGKQRREPIGLEFKAPGSRTSSKK
jgi:hypothetical protein